MKVKDAEHPVNRRLRTSGERNSAGLALAVALASLLALLAVPSPANAAATLTLTPSDGPPQTPVTASGAGVPPGAAVSIRWFTMEGNRVSGVGFFEVNQTIATGIADAQGRYSITFVAPYDLGGPAHRVQAVVAGAEVAESFFVLARDAWITPTEGPEGTLIEVRLVAGGWTQFDNNIAILWDNRFLGFACSFNSQGNISVWVQAVGGVGPHVLSIYPALYWGPSDGPTPWKHPMMNPQDAPVSYAIEEFSFTVTSGAGISRNEGTDLRDVTAPDSLAIPNLAAVPVLDGTPHFTLGNGGKAVAGGQMPYALAGFSANAEVEIRWQTVTMETKIGGALSDKFYGWEATGVNETLATVPVDATGKASGSLQTPMDFGGIHTVEAVVGGNALASAEWWIIPRFTAGLSADGTRIEIHGTGLGWEKYTSVWDILYDGALSGWVSAFTGKGSVDVSLPVVGAPGLHTIEIHEGSNAWPYLNMHQSPWPWEPVYRFAFVIPDLAAEPREGASLSAWLLPPLLLAAAAGGFGFAWLRQRRATREATE